MWPNIITYIYSSIYSEFIAFVHGKDDVQATWKRDYDKFAGWYDRTCSSTLIIHPWAIFRAGSYCIGRRNWVFISSIQERRLLFYASFFFLDSSFWGGGLPSKVLSLYVLIVTFTKHKYLLSSLMGGLQHRQGSSSQVHHYSLYISVILKEKVNDEDIRDIIINNPSDPSWTRGNIF